jgi:hypothetical protein
MIDSGNTILLLRKWCDDETLLLWEGEFRDANFSMTGIISSLSDEECIVASRKGEAKLAFRLTECKFEYVERRAVAESDIPEEFSEKGVLLVFFPGRFSLAEFASETTNGRDTLTVKELHPSELIDRD